MNSKLKFVLFMLIPSVFSTTAIAVMNIDASDHPFSDVIHIVIPLICAALYAIAIIGLIMFYKYKPCNIKAAPAGFALTPLPCLFYELIASSDMRYWGTLVLIIVFTVPFTIAACITTGIVNRREERRMVSEIKKKTIKLENE
ncbi:MAG: hypothetical protein FWG69_02165 [Oscillospiraceae bacterium]|nr:hypothetical protein [Oscillospiraceae bacterium]